MCDNIMYIKQGGVSREKKVNFLAPYSVHENIHVQRSGARTREGTQIRWNSL